jgi:hypothetical protein
MQCVATTTECSSCINPETFAAEFPSDIEALFASTQAFAVPGTPQFCNKVNELVCDEYKFSSSCCCQDQITAWQKCLVEEIFSVKFGLPRSCRGSCDELSSASTGNDFPVGAVAGVGGMILVLVVLGLFFCRAIMKSILRVLCCCRTQMNSHDMSSKLVTKNSHNKLNETALHDIEEGAETSSISERMDDSPFKQHDDDNYHAEDDKDEVFSVPAVENEEEDEEVESPIEVPVDECLLVPTVIVLGDSQRDDDIGIEYFKQHAVENMNSIEDGNRIKSLASTRSLRSEGSARSRARSKKHAIEAWVESKKRGSTRSLQSFVSEAGSVKSRKSEKQEAIQAWIQCKKEGSTRSLRSFISGNSDDESIESSDESLYTNEKVDAKKLSHDDDHEGANIDSQLAALSVEMQTAINSLLREPTEA